MAAATKQWQRWVAVLRSGAEPELLRFAEKGAMQATHDVSIAHSAWTRARSTKGDTPAVAPVTRETTTKQEDPFPAVTKAVDAFQSLVRDELVADGPASQGKERAFESSAQAVVDGILAARQAKPNFKVEEAEPPAAKKRES